MKSSTLRLRACILCAMGSLWLAPFVRGEMRILNTAHYRIRTDLDPRLSEDLATRMEAMYAQYSARLADFSPPKDKRFDVYLFRRQEDYQRFTGNRLSNTGGIFIHSKGQSTLAAFLEGQGRDAMRRTLQHEAFHQFAFTTIGPELPVWAGEGIAQVFEEGIWTGRQFMIGQVPPRRLRQLQADIRDRRLMPFEQFVRISDQQWTRDLADAETGAARYGQAWAMTHFLVFATDETGQPRFRSRLIQMLKLIRGGTKAADAFEQAFSNNYQGFQQRFLEYVRTLQPTREASFIEHQTILADMLVMLDSDGLRFDDIADFRKHLSRHGIRLRYTKGNVRWSTESDPAIYFRDAAGRAMTSEQIHFSPRAGAPLPDLVCKPIEGLQFRTVFHHGDDQIDHETLIEVR